jgi:hypothetical protein
MEMCSWTIEVHSSYHGQRRLRKCSVLCSSASITWLRRKADTETWFHNVQSRVKRVVATRVTCSIIRSSSIQTSDKGIAPKQKKSPYTEWRGTILTVIHLPWRTDPCHYNNYAKTTTCPDTGNVRRHVPLASNLLLLPHLSSRTYQLDTTTYGSGTPHWLCPNFSHERQWLNARILQIHLLFNCTLEYPSYDWSLIRY